MRRLRRGVRGGREAGPLSVDEALRIAEQMAEGLAHLLGTEGSSGMLLGEMLTGKRPVQLVGVPRQVERLVSSALAADAALRPQDGKDWCDALLALRRSRARKRLVPVAMALGMVVVAAVRWFAFREARIRWALQVALPQAIKLAESFRFEDAHTLAEKVALVVPDNPQLLQHWPQIACRYAVESSPTGATISLKPYPAADAPWHPPGRAPLQGVRAPGGKVRLAFPPFQHIPPAVLGDFLIDRTEVTNRAFQEFVDAGGYQRPELWRVPFEEDGW